MRWTILLVLTLRVFANPFDEVTSSAPEEIASLNADLLIDGFVSAASGQISLVESDLHMKSAQDLILQRTYISPQILGRYDDKEERDRLELGKALHQLYAKGWVVLPHLWAGYNRNSPYFQVRAPNGTVLQFEIVGNRGHLKTPGYGCSNLRGGEPSAEADIRNVELWVDGKEITVIWPNGMRRIYQSHFSWAHRLESELLPNGKAIRYFYNDQGLVRISSTDASGKHTYATIDKVGEQHYRGSDGREAKLLYETREIKGKFKKGNYKEMATFQFPVLTKALNPIYPNSAFGCILRYQYTLDGDLAQVGSRKFEYDELGRLISGTGFRREYDLFGNIIQEEFATGLIVKTCYDESDRPTQRILPDQSSIVYQYEGPFLVQVSRLGAKGDLLYTHTYDQFDLNGHVLSETGLFNCSYRYDQLGRRIAQTSPFFSENLSYDEAGNLIRKGTHSYVYDAADQLISSSGRFSRWQ